jgi:hypothetical protein
MAGVCAGGPLEIMPRKLDALDVMAESLKLVAYACAPEAPWDDTQWSTHIDGHLRFAGTPLGFARMRRLVTVLNNLKIRLV